MWDEPILDQGGPRKTAGVLERDRGGHTDTQEKPREGGGGDGKDVTSGPGTSVAQKLQVRKDRPLEPLEAALPRLDLSSPA